MLLFRKFQAVYGEYTALVCELPSSVQLLAGTHKACRHVPLATHLNEHNHTSVGLQRHPHTRMHARGTRTFRIHGSVDSNHNAAHKTRAVTQSCNKHTNTHTYRWLYKKISSFVHWCSKNRSVGVVAQGLAAGLQKELSEYYRLVAVLQVRHGSCIHVSMHACVYFYVCIHMCMLLQILSCTRRHTYPLMYVCMYVYIYIYIYIHVFILYICACVCMYTENSSHM